MSRDTGLVRVAHIIQARDGLDFQEAMEIVKECRDAMQWALMEGDDPEEILAQELGLEPDYLFDLL